MEEHGPCVRITWPAVAGRVAAARVQRYTGTKRGPGIRPWFRYVTGMQGETGEKGRRGTRAKNRARLSCTGTNFPLLFCTRFVNPIAAKSLSLERDYKSLSTCAIYEKEDVDIRKYVFSLILIEDIRKSLQNFVVKRIFDYC